MDLAAYSNFKVNPNMPDFGPGDRVRVSAKVVEGDRERIQVFEGDVIRVRHGGPASTFTVRKITSGIGVERTFQRDSPRVDKVEVVRQRQGPPRPPLLPARAAWPRRPHQGKGPRPIA